MIKKKEAMDSMDWTMTVLMHTMYRLKLFIEKMENNLEKENLIKSCDKSVDYMNTFRSCNSLFLSAVQMNNIIILFNAIMEKLYNLNVFDTKYVIYPDFSMIKLDH